MAEQARFIPGGLMRKSALVLSCAGLAGALCGCEVNSYMDPTVIGGWQHTPTEMPILDRIASIESETGEFVEYSDPTPEDLIAQPQTYRIGAGDSIKVTAYDLIEEGAPQEFEVIVDARGFIEIAQLGRIFVGGMTTDEARVAVENAAKRFDTQPLVSVQTQSQRNQTFNLVGGVNTPGPYFIPKADYRLIEALTAGGRFDETIADIYVIRQVALSSIIKGDGDLPARAPDAPAPGTPAGSKDILDIIDSIAPSGAKPTGNPGVFGSGAPRQPEPQAPAVDLVDGPSKQAAGATTNWVFLNGQWVQLPGKRPSGTGAQAPNADDLVTQRVIRVPLRQLLSGKQSLNIVVRPGDVIRVPSPEAGNVYLGGQISRPGSFQLPSNGKLTLGRAVIAAGGLAEAAIPERVELTRMVGRDRQATIRLNLREISKGSQPDVYLKPDDQINFGTNFWALPLAVIRNGFRASYGFGFILDRNFGSDVFGAPPTNVGG
ncbi:MAG: polysaccharide biosynthesis/export family protein [Phycisphaerales bacterium]